MSLYGLVESKIEVLTMIWDVGKAFPYKPGQDLNDKSNWRSINSWEDTMASGKTLLEIFKSIDGKFVDIRHVSQDDEVLRYGDGSEWVEQDTVVSYTVKDLAGLENYLYELKGGLEKVRGGKETVGFSFEDGWLSYGGKRLSVSKSENSNPFFLLKTLLKDPKKVWSIDELWEELQLTEYKEEYWKKIYNYADNLKTQIAKQTTVTDFIEATKTTVRINPRYL